MHSYDIIDRLPYEIAARIASDPFFVDIPVIVAEAGNVALEMERRQAVTEEKSGKRGAAVIVLQLVADDPNPNLQLGPMKFYPAIQVIEQVEMNNDDCGTKKSHRKIARRIRDTLKTTGFVGLIADLRPGKPCIEPTDLSEIGALLKGSQVNFECLEIPQEQITVVQPPTYSSDANGKLLIACATVGAEIWFTTDDSYPYPGDADSFPGSTSQPYTGPVTMTSPQTIVRACAYLPTSTDAIASWVNRQTIIATI
jgi:hypothetical protein